MGIAHNLTYMCRAFPFSKEGKRVFDHEISKYLIMKLANI